MKKIIAMALAFTLLISLVSCISEPLEEKKPTKKEIISGAPEIDIDIKEIEAETASTPEEAITGIGADILRSLYKGNENLMVSPISISMALGLTSGGAKGDTLVQFEKFLGRGVGLDEMNSFYKAFSEKLDDSEEAEIGVANSIWSREDAVDVSNDFLSFADKYYDAEVFSEPFDSKTVKKINDWVDANTDGMIKEIIDDISQDKIMYLINAISFDAKWESKYYNTSDRFKFTNAAGDVETVTGMYSTEGLYLEDENTTGFIKKYKGGEYSFAVLLPNKDVTINDYVKELTGAKITALLEGASRSTVKASLPKFTFEYSANLNDALKSLGLTLPYDSEGCDLSGLGECSYGNIFVTDVLHKTFIEVAEEGTRAAAVTAVVDAATSAMPSEEIKKVVVDRPFVFAIIENETNIPMFLGTVLSVK